VGCVVGEVTAILQQWKQEPLPKPKDNKGWADLPGEVAQQTVRVRVDDVVFGALGAKGAEIELTKPSGDYPLKPGVKGPFLLRAPAAKEKLPVIVGRYGPDSYRLDVIEAAAKRAGKRA
jgi:hypothetical protein